ncbi:MAG: UDP-N-acetylmuramate dehydrogenase [Octadecabacter sp.]|nr:UDP-N-acetylmuramate dehydrogenase [Octadecabacter sp.]
MIFDNLPIVRGILTLNRRMSDLTWLRVGGQADVFFQPVDEDDLRKFLTVLPLDVPVFVMGVGSNLIVRDGGIRGVVIRLGRGFNSIEFNGNLVRVGAAALDSHVARKAARLGLNLTFLRTIPGSIGGAVTMNAGCYGDYMSDVIQEVRVVMRDGSVQNLAVADLDLKYRSSTLPEGAVIVSATLKAVCEEAQILEERMTLQLAKRDKSQPTKDRTAGSTFRNPSGFSSTGQVDDTHDLKAWKMIDDAGMRGMTRGGAIINTMHSNFLTNAGGATAADLERLGEDVRKKVYETSGLTLEWEIMRVGEPAPQGLPPLQK